MAIIKKKRIRTLSEIENLLPSGLADGEPERAEVCCDGFFKIENDGYSISYSENGENGRVISDITVATEKITVRRRGAIESDMTFSEGLVDRSLYRISQYSFDVVIKTVKIRNNLTRDGGRVDIYYNMNIGGADKRVRMVITAE